MLGIGLGITSRLRSSVFNPASLFRNGEQGWFYDLSDMSTLFQDATGTTPVTAVGQPVGLQLDKSGTGNHRSQSASLPRPTYARHPLGGIRNLLTWTEDFENPDWAATVLGTSTRTNASSVYAFGLGLITATSANGGIRQRRSGLIPGQPYTLSFYLESSTPTVSIVFENSTTDFGSGHSANITPSTGAFSIVNGFTSTTSVPFGNGRIYTLVTANAGGNRIANIEWRIAASGGSILLGRPQFELGSTATAYQRVGSVFDVTEAGQPDLYYLSYDGLNDSLSTAPFAWGSDKATVVAGVRKLSDAAIGMVAETSANINFNNGSFALWNGLNTGGGASYRLLSKGTTIASAEPASVYASPITNVLTGIGDIADDRATLRINGTQVAQSTADQGTGNFGTHQIFFGARGGASLFFNGREYSQFAINRLLTANELSQIERYTAQRTGVTL